MSSIPIQCPGCGANSASDPDAHGIHRCEFCSTRFKVSAGRAVAAEPATGAAVAKGVGVTVLVLGALFALLITGIGAAIWLVSVEPSATGPAPTFALDLDALDAPVAPVAPEIVAAEVVSAPVEVEVEPTATFDFHGVLPSSTGTFYVLGEVTNTSPFLLGQLKLNILLLDEAGAEVHADIGYTERDVIPVGGSSPLSAIVTDAPPYASLAFELVVTKPSYLPSQAQGLHVEPGALTKDGIFWTAKGKVRNDGERAARFVEIEIVGRAADGHIVGIDTTYADGDVLKPGATTRYTTTSVRFTEQPATVEYAVSGRPVD